MGFILYNQNRTIQYWDSFSVTQYVRYSNPSFILEGVFGSSTATW